MLGDLSSRFIKLRMGLEVHDQAFELDQTHATSQSLTALPRLSLNGSYQELRHVETLLSGVPFSLWNLVTSSG